MKDYRIHVPLDGFEGAKTGKTYHATSGALITAPQGEFKKLARGDYSLAEGEVAGTTGDDSSSSTNDD